VLHDLLPKYLIHAEGSSGVLIREKVKRGSSFGSRKGQGHGSLLISMHWVCNDSDESVPIERGRSTELN